MQLVYNLYIDSYPRESYSLTAKSTELAEIIIFFSLLAWRSPRLQKNEQHYWNDFRYQEIRHPRWARHPHNGVFPGLPPFVLVVPQPREPVPPPGADVSRQPLRAVWNLCGDLPTDGDRNNLIWQWERECEPRSHWG